MVIKLLKKGSILFLLLFMVFIKPSKANELKDLFGIKLYENTKKYFSDSYIKSNKYENKETFRGFYDIDVTLKITESNPFLSQYWIVADESNVIQQISAEEKIIDLDKCKDFKKQLVSIFNNKYNLKFVEKDFTHKNFYTHSHSSKVDSNKMLYVKCVNNFIKKKIYLIISFETKLFLNRKKEYYEAGF